MKPSHDPRLVTLEARSVESLPALDGERTDYRDVDRKGRPTGLLLRVSPTGARSFGVRYSFANRDQRYYIGDAGTVSLSAARDEARRVLGLVEARHDPHAEREARVAEDERERQASENAVTVGELSDRFMAEGRGVSGNPLRENTRRAWAGILANHVRQTLGDRPAAAVTRAEVRTMLERIRGEHPVTANRVLEFLRVVFGWAVERELLTATPLAGMRKPSAEHSRARVLAHDEIRQAWAAMAPDVIGAELKDDKGAVLLPALSKDATKAAVLVADALRLALLTGARVSEVTGAPWTEVDLDARLWTVAPSRAKNGSSHPIPLSGAAVTLLRGLKARAGSSPWVFPSTSERTGRPVQKVQDGVRRVRVRAGLADFEGFHDVRRTVRTGLAALNVPAEVAEAVLGHLPPKLSRTYNLHAYVPQMLVALESWARKLDAIVRGVEHEGADVLAFAAR
jgi:integrase